MIRGIIPAMTQRLLPRVHDALRARHYSPRTEESYVHWIRRFIFFHDKRHPSMMGPEEVNGFLTHLAVEEKVSAATQNQGSVRFCSCIALFWSSRCVIGALSGTSRLIAQLLYGSGLRLLECLQLRVKDIDFARHEVHIHDPKGRRDRETTLPHAVDTVLRAHLQKVRSLHDDDLRLGFGAVVLPGALARKFPNAEREWSWQWVFPASRRYVDDDAHTERRHHVHESVVQRAVHGAVAVIGSTKRITCHTFRHHADTNRARYSDHSLSEHATQRFVLRPHILLGKPSAMPSNSA